ncbi:MAG: ABC transporter ATP-binding protein [Pseudonocardiales bacterium]|nr:MAG: ABC transporter ATP-binding protein [Pseudonocardiales bacterium]
MGLCAEAVTVRYGATAAVDAVTLQVAPGQLVAVTGPSGAGKTTLLSACAGMLAPTAGSVTLAGTPVTGRDDAVARGIVLIPQGNALAAVLTALENVAIALLADRAKITGARETAMAALTAVGVDDAAEQLIDELSGGQQQRVAVARALAAHGSVLLADEPTSELDTTNRDRVIAALRAEARRGAAVIIATHDPEAAEQCDAELHLDQGTPTWNRDQR